MHEPILEINTLGTKMWKVDGILHRDHGPAVEFADGSTEWHSHGQIHREDGPAVEYVDGTKEWWLHNQRHHDDGPAIEYANGTKAWYRRGSCHREDGPAAEYADGTKEWWLAGEQYTKPEWLREVLKERPLTPHQRELLHALSENWAGTPERLYETVTHLA